MLSQTAEYALRAVLYLAHTAEPGRPVRVDRISADLGIPANYLSKTLNVLVRAGVLRSMRGPHGGFRLAQEPSRVTLAAVVGPFDQLIEHRSCLLGRATCSDRTACAAHHAWKETADAVERFFRTTTIAEITGAPEILAGAPRSRSAPRSRRTA